MLNTCLPVTGTIPDTHLPFGPLRSHVVQYLTCTIKKLRNNANSFRKKSLHSVRNLHLKECTVKNKYAYQHCGLLLCACLKYFLKWKEIQGITEMIKYMNITENSYKTCTFLMFLDIVNYPSWFLTLTWRGRKKEEGAIIKERHWGGPGIMQIWGILKYFYKGRQLQSFL